MFLTDPDDNNCFFDDGPVYNGNGRYFCGEISALPISIDDVRLLGEKGFNDATDWQTSLTVTYELSERWTLTSITAYNSTDIIEKGDFGFTGESLNPFSLHLFDAPLGPPPTPFTPSVMISGPLTDFAASATGDGWDVSEELRVSYEAENWSVMFGGYFFDSRNTRQENRELPTDFAATVSGAYFGEVARMVEVCNSNVSAFAGPCTPNVFNVGLGPAAFGDFAFAGNSIGLGRLVLNADRSTQLSERKNAAAFGLISVDLTSELTGTAEVRFSRESITSISTDRSANYDFVGNSLGLTEDPTVTRKAIFKDVNPRFALQYSVTDSTNLYAVAARGNKPGGFNSTRVESLGLDTYGEESVWSFELGAKNEFLDQQMTLNLAVFHNTISGYQLSQSVVIPELNETNTVIDNTGKVRLKGIEIETVYAPDGIPGLILNAGYALTDSEILEGTDINEGKLLDVADDGMVNCSLGTADPAVTACDSTGDNTLPGSIVGRRLPRQAMHMLNLGAHYTRAISDRWSLVMNGHLSLESRKFVQVHNLAWIGGATLLGASVGVESESLRLILWGRNLTGEDSVVGISRFADEGASFQRAFMGNPRMGRQFGGTISYLF